MRRGHTLTVVGTLVLLGAACAPAAAPTPTAAPLPTATSVAAQLLASTPAATPRPASTATATPKPAKAAATAPRPGGTVRAIVRGDPDSWDPARTKADPNHQTSSLVFSKLFTLGGDPPKDCEAPITPWVVQDWRWAADTTMDMTLRSSIKYHNRPPTNGRELVATDVVASWEHYRDFYGVSALTPRVEAVTATGKYSVRMKLKEPWGGLVVELLAKPHGPFVEPPEALGAGEWKDPEKWVGSGPFMFDKWIPGTKWSVVRNPDYWQESRPYLDRVEYIVMPDASTQLAALRTRRADLAQDFSPLLLDELLRSAPGIRLVECPGTALIGAGRLWMNNSGPPFDNVLVRRAVSVAIDRQAIAKNLYAGRAQAVPVFPLSMVYALPFNDFPKETQELFAYNPARAKELLAKAGYPSGFDTVINFSSRYAAPAPMTAEAIAAWLKDIGIRAKLNFMEHARFNAVVNRAPFYPVGEMAISAVEVETPEALSGVSAFWSKGGNANRSLVKDAEYDEMYTRFASSTDETKRRDLMRQMQLKIAEQAWAVSLPVGFNSMLTQSGIHFVYPGLSRADWVLALSTAWIEQ